MPGRKPTGPRRTSAGRNIPSERQRTDEAPFDYIPPYAASAAGLYRANRIPFVAMGGIEEVPELKARGLHRDWDWLKRSIAQMRRHGYTRTDVAAMFSVHPIYIHMLYKRWGWKSDKALGIKRRKAKTPTYISKERLHATNRSERSEVQKQ